MTLTLELPTDLEHALAAEAANLGVPIEQYALRVLEGHLPIGETLKTGAELVAYWEREGVIGFRPEIEDSQAYARAVRDAAEHRLRTEKP